MSSRIAPMANDEFRAQGHEPSLTTEATTYKPEATSNFRGHLQRSLTNNQNKITITISCHFIKISLNFIPSNVTNSI